MKLSCRVVAAVFLLVSALIKAETGCLIPSGSDRPRPDILSLTEMKVKVVINEGLATTFIQQVFANRRTADLEANYEFLIPETAALSRFALWEDHLRLPGVVLEKKRAEQIYENLTVRKIDPGLLQQAEEARRHVFSVRVFPVPSLGTKRLELEYTETLALDNLRMQYRLPLRPVRYQTQTCDNFSLEVTIKSELPLKEIHFSEGSFPLKPVRKSAGEFSGYFQARNFSFQDDFTVDFGLDVSQMGFVFVTYRDPDTRHRVVPLFSNGRPVPDTDGYFLARVVSNLATSWQKPEQPSCVLILFDLSLSMRWEKLDRAYEMLEGLLKTLSPETYFQVGVFRDRLDLYPEEMIPATREKVEQALSWVGQCYQAGGTDLLAAVRKLLPSLKGNGKKVSLVVISDGHQTVGELRPAFIVKQISELCRQAKIKIHLCGVGEDANNTLMEEIARATEGTFLWVSETEDVRYKVGVLKGRLQQEMLEDARISFTHQVNRVYPEESQRFLDTSCFSVVGRYSRPQVSSQANIKLKYRGKELSWVKNVSFPDRNLKFDFLPRLWAKARIEELLRLIRLKGENEEWIEEIISLAKQYNLATPYTSFLAAPRSLLRPRAIKPGDPVLRVKTGPEIVQVVAIFPFGQVKRLHYNSRRDFWETRFLIPPVLGDGSYQCQLVLIDNAGRQYLEKKSFVVDSHPPVVKVKLSASRARPGQTIEVRALADADTRSIKARFPGVLPVDLRYEKKAGACLGWLKIPANLEPGVYELVIVAEDFSRNISQVRTELEII